ncbi:MAG: hypothetical protein NBV65_02170, partial [Burkholderiaceae bacterium]|nr:hypothetical protein [Burkholderiaceae bacterium]
YEDESEADEQDDGEGVEQPKYRVKAAGEEREVTLDELIKSYQLGQDYTKKSQMVAEERKVIEAEKTAVAEAKQLRDQYAQRLQMMEQVLSQQMPQEDLESLKDTDPIGYAVKVAEMSQREKQLQAVQAERARIAEQQEADRIGQLQQVVSEESKKLAEAIPDLTDPDKGQAIKRDIREFGKKLGFSDAELANVYDSRAVLTLYKAMQYDRLMASKPQVTKKVQEAPRVLKAGTATTRSDGDAQVVKKLKQQARQSGRVADAAALFERML